MFRHPMVSSLQLVGLLPVRRRESGALAISRDADNSARSAESAESDGNDAAPASYSFMRWRRPALARSREIERRPGGNPSESEGRRGNEHAGLTKSLHSGRPYESSCGKCGHRRVSTAASRQTGCRIISIRTVRRSLHSRCLHGYGSLGLRLQQKTSHYALMAMGRGGLRESEAPTNDPSLPSNAYAESSLRKNFPLQTHLARCSAPTAWHVSCMADLG